MIQKKNLPKIAEKQNEEKNKRMPSKWDAKAIKSSSFNLLETNWSEVVAKI